MYYKTYLELENFDAWSQGKVNLERWRRHGRLREVEDFIIEMFMDREDSPSDTEINDVLWFEVDYINEQLGIDDDEFFSVDDED